MDNLGLFIYLIGIADSFQSALGAGAAICGFVLFVLFILFPLLLDDGITGKPILSLQSLKRIVSIIITIGALSGLAYSLTPSSKTLAAMYIVPAIAQNEDVKHIANDNLKSLRLLSEKWLMELIKEDKEK